MATNDEFTPRELGLLVGTEWAKNALPIEVTMAAEEGAMCGGQRRTKVWTLVSAAAAEAVMSATTLASNKPMQIRTAQRSPVSRGRADAAGVRWSRTPWASPALRAGPRTSRPLNVPSQRYGSKLPVEYRSMRSP
jgi:hypothetical protein